MVTTMASKPPYDPVKALEGMFNGSVARIGYVLKDPINYGSSTQMVLAQSTKRFQDALDDCEIQLLDAKWYLEHQLEINRARREATATEADRSAAAAKREHQEMEENANADEVEDTPKRMKSDQGEMDTQPVTQNLSPDIETKPSDVEPERNESVKSEPKISDSTKVLGAIVDSQRSVPDEYPKETPRQTPTGTNDDFNFVSMFGEPSNEGNDDMNLDLVVGDSYDNNEAQDLSSLNTLLPGLESYANQLGDDENLMNVTSAPLGDAIPTFSNSFDLPEIGGNAFDDFLNDDSLGNGEFEEGVDLTDEAFNNMQFDDAWN